MPTGKMQRSPPAQSPLKAAPLPQPTALGTAIPPIQQPSSKTIRTNEANSDKLFNQMARILKLCAAQERRADRALKELTKLQRDRVLAMDIHTEVYLYDKIVDIPATFPMFEVRKADLSKTS